MPKIPVHIIGNKKSDRAGVNPPSVTLRLNIPEEEKHTIVSEKMEKHGRVTVYVEDMTTYETVEKD